MLRLFIKPKIWVSQLSTWRNVRGGKLTVEQGRRRDFLQWLREDAWVAESDATEYGDPAAMESTSDGGGDNASEAVLEEAGRPGPSESLLVYTVQ